jgi:hypothetical protein
MKIDLSSYDCVYWITADMWISENIVMLVTDLYQTINGYRITKSMNY